VWGDVGGYSVTFGLMRAGIKIPACNPPPEMGYGNRQQVGWVQRDLFRVCHAEQDLADDRMYCAAPPAILTRHVHRVLVWAGFGSPHNATRS
jgi:hypothetical protein